ncbi:MAG: hypothetical protein L3J06_01515 [Cyclobacteriaceae bacterium]|nr:hypothetical protein [Cyclobacteriaceae bacterium]
MDDKFIYYLVIGAIYLVSRMLKKKKPPTPVAPTVQNMEETREQTAPVTQIPSAPKPSSFEDLLKEISQEFESRKEPTPVVAQELEPVEVIKPSPPIDELTREQKYVKRKKQEATDEASQQRLLRLADQERA